MAEENTPNPAPDEPPATSARGPQGAAAPPAPPSPKQRPRPIVVERRRGFVRRWLGRLLALLLMVLVLLLVLLVGLTILLRSDLPRSLAESAATQALGLELTLGDLDIGWGGNITITDFSASLPDFGQVAGGKLLDAERIEAELDSLPLVALDYLRGRQPSLRHVRVESPTVYATQSEAGQWNLARALTLVRSARRGPTAGEGGGIDLPPMPDVRLTGGAVVIRKADGTEAALDGFELTGGRENPLVYRLSGETPSKQLLVTGEFFPTSGRRQQIRLELAGLSEDLRAMFDLPDLALYANWTGGLTNDGIEGMLQIHDGQFGDMRLSGGLRIASSGRGLHVSPEDLRAQGLPTIGSATIPRGSITLDSTIHAQSVLIETLGGQVMVRSASFDPATLSGQLDALFRDISPTTRDALNGALVAELGHDLFGEPFANVELVASGVLGETALENLDVQLVADGAVIRDWGTLDLALRLRESINLSIGGRANTTIPPLEMPIRVRLRDPANPRIEFDDLRSLDPQAVELAGNGVLYVAEGADHAAGEWWVSLWQSGVPVTLPRIEGPLPTQLSLEAEGYLPLHRQTGGPLLVRITQFFGAVGAATISGSAQYTLNGPANLPPLALELTLRRDVNFAPAHFEQIQGNVLGMLSLTGDPRTLEFNGTGGVQADGLVIGDIQVGRVRSDISLTLTRSMLSIQTLHDAGHFRQRTQVLGAMVDLEAHIPLAADEIGHVSLAIEHLDLEHVSGAMLLPLQIGGILGGEVHIDLAGLSLQRAQGRGWLEVRGLHIPGLEVADRVVIGIPPEQAPDADWRGGVFFSDGEFAVPVAVTQHMEVLPGPTSFTEERHLSFNVAHSLQRPTRIVLEDIRSDGYPFEYPAREEQGRYLHLEVSIQPSEMVIDVTEPPQVRGQFLALADVATGIAPFEINHLGAASMTLTALDKQIDITRLLVDLGEVGTITGEGMLDVTNLAAGSRLMVQGRSLNLEALARELRIPEGAAGVADVALLVQPAAGSAPRGEVMIDLSFAGHEANWRGLQIGQGQIIAYASRQHDGKPAGPFDFNLFTTERVHLQIARGRIEGYARLRNRGGGGAEDEWHLNSTVQATALDLGQLAATIDQRMSGRVDVRAAAYGNLSPMPRFGETRQDLPWLPINGEATLSVRRGELRRFNLFNDILNVTNLAGTAAQQDWLDAQLRLEQGDAIVDSIVAQVDGIELRMTGRINDVLEPREATIEATGVALARPLAQIRLPLFGEADDILSTVQSTAGTDTYRASGRLLDPTVVPVVWDEVTETLRVLLVPAAKRQ